MSARIRFLAALSTIVLIGISTLALTLAEPPDNRLPTLELPDIPNLKTPVRRNDSQRNPKVQQKIREALEQGEFAETGDPVLDDVLQVIKNRRSILAGSVLDPAATGNDSEESRTGSVSAKARAAECLLKAARILERIEPADEARRDLVTRMRHESVRLLTP